MRRIGQGVRFGRFETHQREHVVPRRRLVTQIGRVLAVLEPLQSVAAAFRSDETNYPSRRLQSSSIRAPSLLLFGWAFRWHDGAPFAGHLLADNRSIVDVSPTECPTSALKRVLPTSRAAQKESGSTPFMLPLPRRLPGQR